MTEMEIQIAKETGHVVVQDSEDGPPVILINTRDKMLAGGVALIALLLFILLIVWKFHGAPNDVHESKLVKFNAHMMGSPQMSHRNSAWAEHGPPMGGTPLAPTRATRPFSSSRGPPPRIPLSALSSPRSLLEALLFRDGCQVLGHALVRGRGRCHHPQAHDPAPGRTSPGRRLGRQLHVLSHLLPVSVLPRPQKPTLGLKMAVAGTRLP
jgi:hypothetical protein